MDSSVKASSYCRRNCPQEDCDEPSSWIVEFLGRFFQNVQLRPCDVTTWPAVTIPIVIAFVLFGCYSICPRLLTFFSNSHALFNSLQLVICDVSCRKAWGSVEYCRGCSWRSIVEFNIPGFLETINASEFQSLINARIQSSAQGLNAQTVSDLLWPFGSILIHVQF